MQSTPLIAVIDDEARVLSSLKNLLESAGYSVLLFESARPFLDDQNLQQVSCVVSDLHMAPVSGAELVQILRTLAPAMPVILITGREAASEPDVICRLGARFFFKKPLPSQALLEAIATCVTEQS